MLLANFFLAVIGVAILAILLLVLWAIFILLVIITMSKEEKARIAGTLGGES